MSTTLSAIIGTTSYSLSSGALAYQLEEDGVGMAEGHRLEERGPQQHGVTDLGFRLDPRVIQLVFVSVNASESALYTARKELLRIFKWRETPLQLRYDLANGDVRQIDAHYIGAMTMASKDRSGQSQRFGVSLKASDPRWYDPTMRAVVFGLGGGSGSGFTVPITVPVAVGVATLDQIRSIVYAGDWLEYPLIILKGPITNPAIQNVTTGEVLDFAGTTIVAGQSYTINLRYGYKTVTDAAGANQIAGLSTASDLATFHIEADPDAPGGVNDFRVTGSAITSATEIYLQYYDRFIGF